MSQKFRRDFIESQIWSLSISAAFQRGNIYKSSGKINRDDFKRDLKEIIVPRIDQSDSKNDYEFISLLEVFQKSINEMIVNKGYSEGVKRFRFGTLQKLVNLYLKYLWCLGWLEKKPLHCPFDGIILKELNITDNWTESDDVERYRVWVDTARKTAEAKELSIPQWELEIWNKWRMGL